MLNKLIDYLDSNKYRPWLLSEDIWDDNTLNLSWDLGWWDYKRGMPPCCNESYTAYHSGYNSAKEDTEYKLSYIERMVDKFVASISL